MEERRTEPRISLGLPVVLRTSTSAAAGRTIDVSLGGVQVEMLGTLSGSAREVAVEVGLSGREPALLRATIVRRALSPAGRPMLALRFLPGAPAGPLYTGPALTQRAPAAAPAEQGSPASVIALRQLRALGARMLELALEDGDAPPPAALVTWVGRLAAELGVAAPSDVRTNGALFRGIASMYRRAGQRSPEVQPAT